ncbi:MAG: ABC transporter permease [Streptosporangiales bacterium]|jgi:NitT/TauT family transport system permease protein|nr:ABC transporter permease [Streptosporangiales bacterium]
MAHDTIAGLDALDLAAEAAPGGAGARAGRVWNAAWPKLAAIVIFLALWEILYLAGWKSLIFPAPGTTLSDLGTQLSSGQLWQAIETTLGRALGGFAIALVIGVVVGSLVSRIGALRQAVGSMLTGLQTMPSVAWIPFAIILFGSSTSTIGFVVVMASAPSIANALIAGVDYTPPLLVKAGRLMGLARLRLHWHVYLPSSLPTFVSGLKQAWAFTWHSLLTAELVVLIPNHPSLGILLDSDQQQADMPSTIAVMLVILILGVVVDGLFGLWNRSIQRRRGLE